MSLPWQLNLIHLLDFYFLLTFCLSTGRRFTQYSALVRLVVAGPRRWPKLLKLVSEHHTIFLTWQTVAPAGSALVLSAIQLLASRVVWPQAGDSENALTLGKLFFDYPWTLLGILPLAAGVLAVDVYFLIAVGQIDRSLLEKYFDQAEYWLSSRTAHVVKFVTFGQINPRRMVAEEVRKALVAAGDLLNSSLWWTSLQLGLRFFFGLSLWLVWAWSIWGT